jgi:hypothetical protein
MRITPWPTFSVTQQKSCAKKTWQQITHPDDLSADEALARKVLAGELPHSFANETQAPSAWNFLIARVFRHLLALKITRFARENHQCVASRKSRAKSLASQARRKYRHLR